MSRPLLYFIKPALTIPHCSKLVSLAGRSSILRFSINTGWFRKKQGKEESFICPSTCFLFLCKLSGLVLHECESVYVWIKLERFGEVSQCRNVLWHSAQPKDLGSNCQTFLLILICGSGASCGPLGIELQSALTRPDAHSEEILVFIIFFLFAQSLFYSLSHRGNRKWKWKTGWVGHSTHLSHVSTVFVKKGSNLNKQNIIKNIFSSICLPWKSFFLYCSVFCWSNNIFAFLFFYFYAKAQTKVKKKKYWRLKKCNV